MCDLRFLKAVQMAEEQLAVVVAQMHATAATVAEIATVGTLVAPHPLAIAIGLETAFPNLHEIVVVDVALMIVGTQTGTGTDGSVAHDRP